MQELTNNELLALCADFAIRVIEDGSKDEEIHLSRCALIEKICATKLDFYTFARVNVGYEEAVYASQILSVWEAYWTYE